MQKTKDNLRLIIDVLTEARRVCLLGGGGIKFACPEAPAPETPEAQTEKAAGGE